MNIDVLVVEDQQAKLQVVADCVRRAVAPNHTARITHASDAASAWKQLTEHQFDVVIVDLVLPKLVGAQPTPDAGRDLVLAMLDNADSHMPAHIVGLTSYSEIAEVQSGWFRQRAITLLQFDVTTDSWRAPLETRLKQASAAKRALSETPREYGDAVGVVCATDDEFDALRRLAWDWSEISISQDPAYYIRALFRDAGGASRTIVATISGEVGMSAAGIAATKLVAAFRPQYLGICGITAGLKGKVELGDIIAADECWDWGMGKYVDRNGVLTFLPSPRHLALDSRMRTPLRRLREDSARLERIKAEWPAAPVTSSLRIVVGPVASGAAVVAAQEMTEQIATQHRKLLGIEMEAYAVFASAAEALYPRPMAFSLKSVSDFADAEKDDSVRHYACFVCARALKVLVEQHLSFGIS